MTEEIQFLSNRARILVGGAQTDGTFALIESTAPPGDQTPLHVHHDDDEAFYVLEGELTAWVGDEKLVLRSGDAAFAPMGIPHAIRTGDEGARWLVTSTPAGFEPFVRAVGAAGMPSPEELTRIAAEHRIEILGPPGMLPAELKAAGAS
jgi:quercetin dioxygenase-like cupin family protein